MKLHWHVGTGITGYGPEEPGDALTIRDAADVARDELDSWCDGMVGEAESYADDGDFKSAWFTHKLTETLETLRANMSPQRADAPMFRDDPQLWDNTLAMILGAEFPAALNIGDTRRMYVWTCSNTECKTGDEGGA